MLNTLLYLRLMNKEEEIEKLDDKIHLTDLTRHEIYHKWVQNLVVVAAALLSALISLKSQKSATQCEHILYIFTISFIVVWIISGALVVYGNVNLLDRVRNELHERLNRLEKDVIGFRRPENIYPHRFFIICQYIFYWAMALSIITLLWYAIIVDTPYCPCVC